MRAIRKRSARDERDYQKFLWTTAMLRQELAAEQQQRGLWLWA
jgi:hypothetical protein